MDNGYFNNKFKIIIMMELFINKKVMWIIVMFLSAVWTLIVTAPIHCRGSIGEQVM